MSNRTLCLNVTYEPLGFLPQDRAVCLLLENKVELIEAGDKLYRSPSTSVQEPLVVRLKKYIKPPRTLREAITPRVLFARDNHTCQYCGKHQNQLGKNNKLTIDHVQPKSKGGPHHWENVVAACYKCNLRKRDRTPLQANMNFVDAYKDRSPKKPELLVYTWGGRANKKQQKWIKSYYGIDTLNAPIFEDEDE